ncbi:MAG: hypothetical protein H0X26_07635 [Alphaproteobacteria bacterium]|nr:hypothetical protein [Alphaproteobacteria bacterium]
MLAKFTSYLLIFSILVSDAAWCGKGSGIRQADDGFGQRRKSVPAQLRKQSTTPRARSQSLPDVNNLMARSKPLVHSNKIISTISTEGEKLEVKNFIVLDIIQGLSEDPVVENIKEDHSFSPPKSTSKGDSSHTISSDDLDAGAHTSVVFDIILETNIQEHTSKSREQTEPSPEGTIGAGVDSKTHSVSTDSLTDSSSDQDLNINTPVITLLREDKVQNEEQLGEEVGKTTSIPLVGLSEASNNKPEDKTPEPLLTPSDLSLEKFVEKGEPSLSTIVEEKQPLEIVEDSPKGTFSEKTVITKADSSPRDGQESTSRRNSDSSDEGAATHETEVQTNSLVDAIPLQMIEHKEIEQKEDSSSSPSSQDKSSDTLNTTESSSPENSDSSKISLEDWVGAQTNTSSDGEPIEEKPSGLLLLDNEGEKEPILLNPNKEKRDFPTQKKREKKERNAREPIISISENPDKFNEGTSLLSNIRKPVKKTPEKKGDLTKDWEKTGTDNDSDIEFRRSRSLSNLSFEGDIEVTKPKKKFVPRSSDDWVFMYENPGSHKTYEMHSVTMEGDEYVLIEDEEKNRLPSLSQAEEKLLPTLIPDGLKGFIENEDLVSNIQVSLENEGSEEESSDQGPMVLNRPRQHKLDQLLNDLPPGARSDLMGRVALWEQIPAMLLGAAVGGAAAYGIACLWGQGILNLASDYDDDFIILLSGGTFFDYILATVLFDTVIRNALYGKKAASYLSRRGANMADVISIGTISFLPSLISPFAFISIELGLMADYGLVGLNNHFAKRMLAYSPFLYLNDWFFNIYTASGMKTNMKNWVGTSGKEWAETSGSWFAPLASKLVLYISPPSEEEMRKQRFNKKLGTLIHHLPSLSNEKMREIYETIQSAKATIATELPELESLEATVKFLTYRYVLSLGHEMEKAKSFCQGHPNENIESEEFKQEPKPEVLVELDNGIQPLSYAPLLSEDGKEKKESQKKSWYEIYDKATDILIGASLVIGSPARLITFTYIVQESVKAMMYASTEAVLSRSAKISSGIFAFLTGFPMQTGLEYKGMKNFAEMIWSMENHGHESYPWARRSIKGACVVQGFILAVPVLILALQACTALYGDDWLTDPDFTPYKWISLTSIFNYFLAEWAVQTTLAEEFWNKTFLTGAIDGGNQYFMSAYNQHLLPVLNEHIQPLVSNYVAPMECMDPTRTYQQDWLIRFFKDSQDEIDDLHPQLHFELEKIL